MLIATKDKVLPTTITGSIPRPAWFTAQLGDRSFREAMGDNHYREQYFDAVSSFIRDQERAGLDVVTDGDSRFDPDVGGMAWFTYAARRLGGMEGYDPYRVQKGYAGAQRGDIVFEIMESRMMPRAVGEIDRGNLDYTPIWKTAQQMTPRPVKFGTITPELIATSVGNEHYKSRRDLILAVSDALHDELTQLADAGCSVIQMEEPNIHLMAIRRHHDAEALDADFFVDVFNRTVKGLREKTEVWCHTCWGNPGQQRLFAEAQTYEPALEHLNQLDVDVITFETASTGGMDFAVIGRQITDKKVAVGVVDHRNLQVERPEDVANLIRKALEQIPAERLVISSDCGFGREGMSRRIAYFKMVSIVRGTNIVREELGLPLAESAAADPKFQFAEEV
ncbi:MAG: cobalamin-independent methionine synthase II family protein [bacterium]